MAKKKARAITLNQGVFNGEEARGKPEVILEFLFDRGVLSVSVRNIGTRAAMKVAVSFDRSFTGLGGSREISSLALFKNVEFLGPAREIVTLLDTSASYFTRKQPTKIAAQVSYLDADDRKYEATINHDLEIYRELTWVSSTADDEV
jgi:hypothetical protein